MYLAKITQGRADAEQQRLNDIAQAVSNERQAKENADRFAIKERNGVDSLEDFLKAS